MGAGAETRPASGHVFRVERTRGPVWYAKYWLPDGRQVQKKLGPAWTERGRPAAGSFTKRTAEAWLRSTLGAEPGMTREGGTQAGQRRVSGWWRRRRWHLDSAWTVIAALAHNLAR